MQDAFTREKFNGPSSDYAAMRVAHRRLRHGQHLQTRASQSIFPRAASHLFPSMWPDEERDANSQEPPAVHTVAVESK